VDRREAIAADLRALADDLKSLVESATTDPKERQRKERRWGALQGGIAILTTMAARRLATKAWGILTGEQAPVRSAKAPPPRSERSSSAESPVRDQTETIASSSSSVK
jgi:hypothetical protein